MNGANEWGFLIVVVTLASRWRLPTRRDVDDNHNDLARRLGRQENLLKAHITATELPPLHFDPAGDEPPEEGGRGHDHRKRPR